MEPRKARIPKRFQLMGHEVRVQRIPATRWKHPKHEAYFRSDRMTIELCSGVAPSRLEQAFWHEATHGWLFVMGHPLYDDEPFVEVASGLIHQIITTSEY